MKKLLGQLLDKKIIAIIRGITEEHLILKVGEALSAGGVTFMEVTFSSADMRAASDTLNAIKALKKYYGDRIHVGAGTVLNLEQLEQAVVAGAEYIISPNVNLAVIRRTKELGCISIPGAYTPTEAQLAWENGADLVKIFPADSLGARYFKELKAPLRHIRMAAVGGIGINDIKGFTEAGAEVFGIGSNLVGADNVKAGNWAQITAVAQAYNDAVQV